MYFGHFIDIILFLLNMVNCYLFAYIERYPTIHNIIGLRGISQIDTVLSHTSNKTLILFSPFDKIDYYC